MAQNKPTDGQGMVVDLAPTVRVVEAKLTRDIDSLKAVLARSSSSLRDFAEQNRLLAEIQASIRAIDVLSGRTESDGATQHKYDGASRQRRFSRRRACLGAGRRPWQGRRRDRRHGQNPWPFRMKRSGLSTFSAQGSVTTDAR